ncbi:MAG: ACP S-malonyltransferase [Bdellovibrionales bacterium]|nr:ACP S-malonyltransferase [Bdellovibrionales bacterium]
MTHKNQWMALFPGQGAQSVGMGKELYENFPVVRQTFEEASDSIKKDLKKLCFDGPESELTLTENTQPALVTVSIAAFRVAQSETGFFPSVVAGHSLGEYSALVAAGALSLPTAVQWVRERGASMQRAVPAGEGAMAAVMGGDSWIDALCEKATASSKLKRGRRNDSEDSVSVEAIVQPANFNAPGQIVIAGSSDAVSEAISLIKTDPEFSGGKAIPLNVSAPFHCRLMEPARKRMAEIFADSSAQARPAQLKCPYVPNRTGRMTQESGVILDLLIEQVDHPVLWKQSMAAMLESDFGVGVEFGPGKVLQGLAKRISQALSKPCTVHTLGDLGGLTNLQSAWKP